MRKYLLIVVFSLLFLTGCSFYDDNENILVKSDKSYSVCGHTIYLGDYKMGDTLDMNSFIDSVLELCQLEENNNNKAELKSRLSSIVDDGDMNAEDIRNHIDYLIDEYFD